MIHQQGQLVRVGGVYCSLQNIMVTSFLFLPDFCLGLVQWDRQGGEGSKPANCCFNMLLLILFFLTTNNSSRSVSAGSWLAVYLSELILTSFIDKSLPGMRRLYPVAGSLWILEVYCDNFLRSLLLLESGKPLQGRNVNGALIIISSHISWA